VEAGGANASFVTDAAGDPPSVTISFVVAADLSVTKSGPASITVGDTFSDTIVAHNGGPSPASGVVVTDTLPGGVAFVSATPAACSLSGALLTCPLGPLAVGASTTVTVTLAAMAPGSITDTATVSANEQDTTPADNSASFTTAVRAASTGGGTAGGGGNTVNITNNNTNTNTNTNTNRNSNTNTSKKSEGSHHHHKRRHHRS
jgi:uncharacterized repeat protein (TIGR01451 family)